MKQMVLVLLVLTCLPVFAADDIQQAEHHINRGIKYYKDGNTDSYTNIDLMNKAAAEFTKALRYNADSAEARYYLGLTCLAMDNKDCARSQLDTLKGLDTELASSLDQKIGEYKAPAKVMDQGPAVIKGQPLTRGAKRPQPRSGGVKQKPQGSSRHKSCHA